MMDRVEKRKEIERVGERERGWERDRDRAARNSCQKTDVNSSHINLRFWQRLNKPVVGSINNGHLWMLNAIIGALAIRAMGAQVVEHWIPDY